VLTPVLNDTTLPLNFIVEPIEATQKGPCRSDGPDADHTIPSRMSTAESGSSIETLVGRTNSGDGK
jgi:hypothetical protein